MNKACSIDGCDRRYRCSGFCALHYGRWRRETPPSERPAKPTTEQRFWAKVAKGADDECWNWTAQVSTSGYGSFAPRHEKPEYAHRYSLRLKLGRALIPGARVCHTCDNRLCVNPAHLYEGDAQTNADDAVKRGRVARGRMLPIAKLTEAAVIAIRERSFGGEKNIDLAEEFGIAASTVSSITHGNSWAHAGGPRSYKLKQKTKRKKAA